MGKMKKPEAPDHLTMRLHAPGMSLLHRAGLGGLACTLKAMEREAEAGRFPQTRRPASFADGQPPWDVTDDLVTLRFGKPELAGEYLEHLFKFAFQTDKRDDGLIYLPGQFFMKPPDAILADLQAGLTLTFLQHGKIRQLGKEPRTKQYEPEGDSGPGVMVQYRECTGFKHQKGWQAFLDKKGCLSPAPIRVDGPISPGAVVRHVQYTSDTAAEDPPDRMLPLYFALVGCLPLPVNRGVAALIVPDVESLIDFAIDRPAMSPTTPKEAQIANAADGALRAQSRLRRNPVRDAKVRSASRRAAGKATIPGCYVMTFTPTPWASQQKSRVATIHVPRNDDRILDRFEVAEAHLPPRIVQRTVKETTGKGKNKISAERQESFRTDSVVRPLIASNLARGRPWYTGFFTLMAKVNPATDKPYRNQLSFERTGLHNMITDPKMWDHEGEALIVKAVHEAILYTRGRIKKDTDGPGNSPPSPATLKRWGKFEERLRLSLVGAKTANQVRNSFADLFSRAGQLPSLQENWRALLPMLSDQRWQLARDLGLIALASYAGKGSAKSSSKDEAASVL